VNSAHRDVNEWPCTDSARDMRAAECALLKSAEMVRCDSGIGRRGSSVVYNGALRRTGMVNEAGGSAGLFRSFFLPREPLPYSNSVGQ
jgi:hypothetical protein